MATPREVLELEIQERPPSTLQTSTAAALGGVGAGDLGALTTNAKKRRRWTLWEVLELEIREHLPSTLENVDGSPPGGADGDLGVPPSM
jgi:hypothetical protein